MTVKDNTALTGSVIDSKAAPDKNSLTTGSLTMKDIENKASYEDSYRGIGYTYDRGFTIDEQNAKRRGYATAEEKENLDNNDNKVGLVPDLGMSSKDSASSMTKSAIAPGKLTVTKGPVNLNTVNRDTKNSLNELAKLFAKNADEAIHQISESKGWENGSKEKIALHTLVGGITAELGGHAFIDGGLAGGVNEAAVAKLMNAIGKDNPDMIQIASAVLGYATNKLAGKDGQAGAAVAQWGTKWNGLDTVQQSCYAYEPVPTIEQYLASNIERGHREGLVKVIESAYIMSAMHPELGEVAENDFIYSFNQAAGIVGIWHRYDAELGMTNNLRIFLQQSADLYPDRDMVYATGKLGVGFGLSGTVGGLGVQVSANSHADWSTNESHPKIVTEATLGAKVLNTVGAWVNPKNVYTPVNHQSENKFDGGVGYKKGSVGVDNGDVIITVGGEGYLGAGAGGYVNFNLSKIGDVLLEKWTGKKEKETEKEEILRVLEGK